MFWGVYALAHSKEYIESIDLSPFFLNTHLKSNIYKKEFITFGYLTKPSESNHSNSSQSYTNFDDSYLLVSDARIDNKDDLIKQLNIDSDVSNEKIIISAYKKWGIVFPEYIVGDFAIVLWDSNKQQLICVRDRLGLKTLYYHTDKKHFSFATEISPLLQLPNYQTKPNINSMKQFLRFPTELEYSDTMYDGINSLPPGHILIVENSSITLQRYWFPERIKINHALTFKNAKETFYELFQNAVRVRMDPCSPTGVDLSGGLDSSSVAAVAQKNQNVSPILSCSIQYGNYKCDETEFIQSMVNKIDIKNIKIDGHNVDFKSKYDLDFIYRLNPVWPNFVNSAGMIPLVERLQKEGIYVVLTGIGGDQTLTGSLGVFTDYLKRHQWRALLSELITYRFNLKIIKSYLLVPLLNKKQKFLIKKLIYLSHFQKKDNNNNSNNTINVEDCASFEQSDHIRAITSKYFSFWGNAVFFNALKQYGIEYRHPFYDTHLIEFLLSLPPGYRYKNGVTKLLLRETMKDLLSKEVYSRNDKAEFSEVIYDQIMAIDLDDFWKNKYISKLNIVSEEEISKVVKQFNALRSKNDHTVLSPLWRLINLEKWYRVNFVD